MTPLSKSRAGFGQRFVGLDQLQAGFGLGCSKRPAAPRVAQDLGYDTGGRLGVLRVFTRTSRRTTALWSNSGTCCPNCVERQEELDPEPLRAVISEYPPNVCAADGAGAEYLLSDFGVFRRRSSPDE